MLQMNWETSQEKLCGGRGGGDDMALGLFVTQAPGGWGDHTTWAQMLRSMPFWLQVNAKTFLEKRYADDMELEDVVHTALLTLKEGFEGQISGDNIEVAVVGEDQKFRLLTPAEISDYLQEVE